MAKAPKQIRIPSIYDGQPVNWPTTIALAILHVGAIAGLFFTTWRSVLVAAFLYWLTIGLGISLGYHRLHTHRSYRIAKPIEYFLAFCGAMTLEGGPISWVATHRLHHQNSDQHGDPHSPRDGVWWAHAGWLLFGESAQTNTRLMSKYAPDLARDPFYVTLNNYHWAPLLLTAAVLFAIGGWSMCLWGSCIRVVVGLHATWLVNSATHLWGSRRFATRDDSRNNWWVALLTFGEGWHNNHHAHPTSARHGLAWYEFDPSWLQLKVLKALGIAKAIQVAKIPTEQQERKAA